MNFIRFIFRFLYTRNWHTGVREISRPRLFLFLGMISLLLVGVVFALFLQMPVEAFEDIV